LTNWDVFHADRLELERSVSTDAIREGLARGSMCDDDLVRPAGTTVAWGRIADLPELMTPLVAPDESPPIAPPPTVAPNVQPAAAPSLPPGSGTAPPSERQPGPANPPRSGTPTSDFEVVAAEAAPDATTPPTAPAPDWFNLRSETDDVAFPVIKDIPKPSGFADPGPSKPAAPLAPGWSWEEAEDDDDESEDDDRPDDHDAAELTALRDDDDQLEILDDDAEDGPAVRTPTAADPGRSSRVALAVAATPERVDIWSDEAAELADEGNFSLSRSGPVTVEELDLAPMVDVAFQLVLFFMVTATTVLYKTLEIPKPSTDAPQSGVTQGRSRSLEDLQNDYILVEIDSSGMMKIDREPVAANMTTLIERLRSAREKTGRKSMLLSAEHATKHRSSVLAYDAANEIGLGIVIARPQAPQAPAPALAPATSPTPAANADAAKPADARPPPG
jgi:biopolymer transport protein ExbD